MISNIQDEEELLNHVAVGDIHPNALGMLSLLLFSNLIKKYHLKSWRILIYCR